MSEGLIYWKNKSYKLANDFFKTFQEMKNENEKMKEALQLEMGKFEEEIFDTVRKIKQSYKKVSNLFEY